MFQKSNRFSGYVCLQLSLQYTAKLPAVINKLIFSKYGVNVVKKKNTNDIVAILMLIQLFIIIEML